MPDEINDILKKYKKRLDSELGNDTVDHSDDENVSSREYEQFKSEIIPPTFTLYEKACNTAEKLLKISPDKKKIGALNEAIETAHLNATPAGTTSLSLLLPLIVILIGVMGSMLIPMIMGNEMSVFFMLFSLIAGVILIFPLQYMPYLLANSWRMKASNQMVLCIFYIVTYMRHTSNLELAVEFASNHLTGPLALDLKKVLWDIETEKYSTLKESLDSYLEKWRKWNLEFVEAMHLVESSLMEGSEGRRLELLDKSLDIILEETYEKMLHYAQNLKSPITTLHMLGVILPILGLVILPLVVNFMAGVKWYFIAAIYNIALPIGVYYLGTTILAQRPTGYGDTDISAEIPALRRKKFSVFFAGSEYEINPATVCAAIGIVVLIVGALPIIIHLFGYSDIGFGQDNIDKSCQKDICFLEYRVVDETTGAMDGPYDLLSSTFSLLFPLSIALSIGLFYRMKTKGLMKIREHAKKLEQEFASALFQLGNRLGDGLPAEIAFAKAANIMQDTEAGKFFKHVSTNIQKFGMNVTPAIFDPKVGAITSFPSRIIESSMKVLIQAIKKGPRIAANALINISRYIKEMHRVSERLKDLLADVITSMKSQISMLTPVIAGIVVGLTSMITNILGRLGDLIASRAGEDGGTAFDITSMLQGNGIPTYYFQIVVGIYVVQIVYILTILSNGIENGTDKLNEEYMLGRNLVRSTVIYCVIALIIMIVFNFIAEQVIQTAF